MRDGDSPTFGGGGSGACLCWLYEVGPPGIGGDSIPGWAFGKGDAIACGAGVPRRELGSRSFIKLAGISFQSPTFLACAAGANDGDDVVARGGGASGACC